MSKKSKPSFKKSIDPDLAREGRKEVSIKLRSTQKDIQTLERRILGDQKKEEEKALDQNTPAVYLKAEINNPPIFMVKYIMSPDDESKNITRCCLSIYEIIQNIIVHALTIRDSIEAGISLQLPFKYQVYCYTSFDGVRVTEFTNAELLQSDGNINIAFLETLKTALYAANNYFKQLPPDLTTSILSHLHATYGDYTGPDSIIRRVHAYDETNQKLTALAIDPAVESYLTSLISGYEDELKGKNVNDYIRWLDDANAPDPNTFGNPERTLLYLQTTFDQIERAFSIDINHIIMTTLDTLFTPEGEPVIPRLEDIEIGDTIELPGIEPIRIPDGSTFSDVLQQIDALTDPAIKRELHYIYNCYFLLKSLCFILHDKPVNAFVERLYEFIVEPMLRYTRRDPKPYPLSVDIITAMVEKWRDGFYKGGSGAASQTRSHATASELTTYFTDVMREKGIFVPKKILLYSMPYSIFRYDKTEQQVVIDMLIYYIYGLSDAVGNDFLRIICKNPDFSALFPLGPANQDAAPPSRTNGPLTVIKENIHIENSVAINTAVISSTDIELETQSNMKNLNSIEYNASVIIAEPVRFGDIAIYSLQNGTVQPFVLYYLDPNVHFPETTIADLDPYLSEFVANLNISWGIVDFNAYKIIKDSGDEEKVKILFGVSYGRISQNDTIPLIKDLLDMRKSARGAGPPKNIITLKWLAQNKNNAMETIVKMLLASFTKELGDQAKRNMIELLNKDPVSEGKGLLATVDTFLPHAFINGACIVRAGNIEIYEQEGFRTINKATIINILKILRRYSEYAPISDVVNAGFLPQMKDSISRVISYLLPHIQQQHSTPNVDIFKHVLLYCGILSELSTNRLLIGEAEFNSIAANYIQGWKTPGFTDDISFMRRILFIGNIRELFAIYEKDIDTYQSFSITYESGGKTFTEKNLHRIIEKYYRYYYDIRDFDFDVEINKILAEAPLFYLLKYWNNIGNIVAPTRYPTKPPPAYSIMTYAMAVAAKLNDFITKYINPDVHSFLRIGITNFNSDLVGMIGAIGPVELAYDDSQSSHVEDLIDYANNKDAQNRVDEPSPGVSVQIVEQDIADLGNPLPAPSIPSVIDPTLQCIGSNCNLFGGKSYNKNRYSNRNLTKKTTKRSRKTRKITKRPKYIKKNVTKHR